MSRRQLCRDLAAVRALVADGRARLSEATGEVEQFWLTSARLRLEWIDNCLIMAASGLGGWARTLTGTATMLAGAAATALVTRALGFGVFWVVACSWVVGVLVETPVRKWTETRLSPGLGRKRLASAVTSEPPLSRDLAALAVDLATARTRLVSATLRWVGSSRWRPAYLAQRAAEDPTVHELAEADILLCQAIDFLEQYLAAETKEES
jgi:hypothetical protein